MEKFYGFDLGDAESAVSLLVKDGPREPAVLPVSGAGSFITAWARLSDRDLVIGENACYHPDAVERHLRFKSGFLTDPDSASHIRSFASGVLGELYESGSVIKGEDSCFYIGCPAGWDPNARERYRTIFTKLGYPPVRIISESRAALVSACQSRHLQVGYDILSHPVLVVDMGSSTTDFAYISAGREVELQTAGEVRLGGGIMDELLLEISVNASPDEKKLRRVFAESEPWRSYCEFAARRLKEKYFADQEYWEKYGCTQTVRILGKEPLDLTLRIGKDVADRILYKDAPALNGRSFHQVFTESLRNTREKITGTEPELLFLTGGVSKLPALADWCREVYPDVVVITSAEPEYSVARGLAWCGRIDEDMRLFRKEIDNLKDSSTVERIVEENLDDLYRRAVETLTMPILKEAVLPCIIRWREGKIRRLCDIDAALEQEITAWLHTDEARALLTKPVTAWMKHISYALETLTQPICIRYNVPYRALSLSSYLALSDIDIKVDARNVFAVDEITYMIDTIVTVLVGLLCGGGGIAIISSGLPGVIAGIVISLLVLFLGKDKIQKAVLKTDLPVPMRKLFPMSRFDSRLEKISDQVRDQFMESLTGDRSEEITDRMISDISGQIEDCLVRMAQIVEIPLG